jgi:hypothetical protein
VRERIVVGPLGSGESHDLRQGKIRPIVDASPVVFLDVVLVVVIVVVGGVGGVHAVNTARVVGVVGTGEGESSGPFFLHVESVRGNSGNPVGFALESGRFEFPVVGRVPFPGREAGVGPGRYGTSRCAHGGGEGQESRFQQDLLIALPFGVDHFLVGVVRDTVEDVTKWCRR